MTSPLKIPKTVYAEGNKKKGRRKPTFTEQARRKQILDVSSRLFMSSGFKNTSVDDIAREAGVSRGVIFYYFDGKQEIGEQTIWESLRQYGEYVQDRVGRKKTSKTQLLEFIDACLDYQQEHLELYLLTLDLVGCFGDNHDRYQLTVFVNQRTREWLMDIIQAGQKNGEIGKVPASELADVIQGFVDGLMEMTAMEPDAVNIDGCKKLIRKMVLSTIKP